MAIRDLLWACPLCRTEGGLRPARAGEECSACGAVFRRAGGASIEARLRDGTVQSRSAGEWAGLLPPQPGPAESGEAGRGGAGAAAGPRLWRRDRVLARFAVGEEVIRRGGRGGRGEFLGMMEKLGPELPGTLELSDVALELRLEQGEAHRWALDELSALQASSRTVQVRPRGQPIVSFSFPESSARLWEESIAAALRQRWRTLGRGRILEFQPRIVAEPAAPHER